VRDYVIHCDAAIDHKLQKHPNYAAKELWSFKLP